MKEAVWLFLHICDAADWEKGIVYDWRDREIAIDMSLSTNTVRGWRQRLEDFGYIRCVQRQHGLEIIIHNWTNPREYGGKVVNRVFEGDMVVSPSLEGDMGIQPSIPDSVQGESQGESQVLNELRVNPTSFIDSESISISTSRKDIQTIPIHDIKADFWATIKEQIILNDKRSFGAPSQQWRLDACIPLSWNGRTLTVATPEPEWCTQRLGRLCNRFIDPLCPGASIVFQGDGTK